ncbi:MAG: anti-sigma factor antagonist [Gemmatimonadales bacterium]|nr:MAG: anti-sigma factor antagonist [Gemmatimonadales bacterium]
MSSSNNAVPRRIAAPETLGLDTRHEFRRAAIDLLDTLPEGRGRLVIDLGPTAHVDSAGLGALMLIQRHAAERRQIVALEGASDELRFLLTLTKLDDLFEVSGTKPA